jgi:uncharacterized membrane protein YcaP (DUF421 family)
VEWLTTPLVDVAKILATGVLVFAIALAYARLVGLRSFAKMSNLDFASTIAIGSTMASVILSPSTSVASGAVTLGILFLFPWAINALRRRNDRWRSTVDNDPTLLMVNGEVIEANLYREQLTLQDLRSKLREAGVTDPKKVLAVVLETTGNVSVIHGDGPLDPWLLEGVDVVETTWLGGS